MLYQLDSSEIIAARYRCIHPKFSIQFTDFIAFASSLTLVIGLRALYCRGFFLL